MTTRGLDQIIESLEFHGAILLQDKKLRNIVSLVTGENLARSWWGHKKGAQIFHLLHELEGLPFVSSCKIISGKVTFIHKSIWSSIYKLGTCGEPWQIRNLSEEECELLDSVTSKGQIENPPKMVKKLEERHLLHSYQVHTDQGKHICVAQSWKRWAEGKAMGAIPTTEESKEVLENVVKSIGGSVKNLPW